MDTISRLEAQSCEGRYRLLVEAITDYAIYMLDRDGYVISWNPGASRFKGYEANEIIGRHFSTFYTDAERMQKIPVLALEEAALIDGCGVWQTFLRVSLPLSAPGLAATAVLCFILSWNDFFFALILTRTQASTAPVAIVNFIQYTGWEWGRIAAAATLVMLPVVVFSLLVRNYLVRGLTAGGTKE